MTITGYIHDTRRAGVTSSGTPVPGLILRDMKFRRMGSIAPQISNPPSNHWQSTCCAYIPHAQKPEDVQIINADVEDWGENIFEGQMTVINVRAKLNPGYDANMAPPNPGALYGNMIVKGGVIDGYRGYGYFTGGTDGAGVNDVFVDGVTFSNPRPTTVYGAPEFVRVQVNGAGNVADNVVIQNCVGFDTTGNLTTDFTIAATGGASFTSRCHVTGNKSSRNSPNITPGVRQLGNSWQRQANVAVPTGGTTVDEECRATIARLTEALVAAGLMAPS